MLGCGGGMIAQRLAPRPGDVAVADLAASVVEADAQSRLGYGDARVLALFDALSVRLSTPDVARRFPALTALGFFLRTSSLHGFLSRVRDGDGEMRSPRGIVFQIMPSNVESLFVYSWAFSALAGNTNVIRMSSRSSPQTDFLLGEIAQCLDSADPAVAQTQQLVRYPRDRASTDVLSAIADVRVVWGGDHTVQTVRASPLRPDAREVCFPDRTSFAILSAHAWTLSDERTRRALAAGLVNDIYWFDQAACSSPRTLFLIGTEKETRAAQHEITVAVEAEVRHRGLSYDASMRMERLVRTYARAVDGAVASIDRMENNLSSLRLERAAPVNREWLGSGSLVWSHLSSLTDVAALVTSRDQTMSHFGFGVDELREFVSVCARPVSRLVPVGAALAFGPVWDGLDLLREFSRIVAVSGWRDPH